MSLTPKDREFILKIAKQYGEMDKKITNLTKDVESLKSNASGPQKIKAPVVSMQVSPDIRMPGKTRARKDTEFGNSKIEIVFKDKRGNDPKQRVLVESLYRSLKELCVKNNIYTLNITISNK